MTIRASIPRVHLGIQACQGPDGYLWHGLGRYVREQTVHLLRDHRELIAGLHFDRELPVPRTLGDFCGYGLLREYPPSGDGLVDEDSDADVFHVTSPLWPTIPLHRLIPSPFLHTGAKLVVTLYDLIPLIFEDQYLSDPRYKQWFTSRLRLIQEADHVLAISETTRDDAVRLLGLDPERITVIYGGVRDDFRQADKPAEVVRAQVMAQLPEIRGPYVLYPAGTAQFRKNIGGAIEAYARLPLRLRETMQLVATGYFLEPQRKALEEQACKHGVQARLVLPGFVTEDLLRELYQACELCIYPSLYEGFGLPILEAMRCGAAVVTSDRSSTKELVEIPEARFDPEDPSHMARVMERALSDEDLRQKLIEYGLQRSRQFTWERVAQLSADCYREVGASMVQQGSCGLKRPMSLAFCTPYPPEQSGVADYNEVFLRMLCARHSLEVDVVVKNDPKSRVPPGHPAISVISARQFHWLAEHGHYDAIVYCMGNSPFHDYIHALLKEHPGVVWLHDVRLTDFYRWYCVQGGRDPSMLPEELLPWARRYPDHEGDLLMRDNVTYHDQGIYLAGEVASYARKIVVNSRFSKELVEIESGATVPVVVVPHAAMPPDRVAAGNGRATLAAKYGLDQFASVVISSGYVDPVKCPEPVIDAVAALAAADESLVLAFVGPCGSEYRSHLEQRASQVGIEDRVLFTGYVEEAEFNSWLAVARCAIQLRFPTNGESSGAVMRCLAAGVPTIVSDHGPLRELPDDAVKKVPTPVQPAALANALRRVLSDDQARERLHLGALRYSQEVSLEAVADQFWTEVLCPPRNTTEPREKINLFNFHDKTFAVVGSERDGSVMRELEVLSGQYETHITNLLPEIINPDFVCLDIGANIGVTTLALSSLSRDGHVYSFEPSRYNYEFLARNVKLNDAENVTCMNLAIYDTNGTLDFSYLNGFGGGSFSATTGFVHPGAIQESVRCVTLDEWVKSSSLARLDFVKLDVEGAEIKVLEGGKDTLMKFKPRLIVELNPYCLITFFNQRPEALFELLRSIYPNVYLISRPDGALKKIGGFNDLQAFFPTELRAQDLYCTF